MNKPRRSPDLSATAERGALTDEEFAEEKAALRRASGVGGDA